MNLFVCLFFTSESYKSLPSLSILVDTIIIHYDEGVREADSSFHFGIKISFRSTCKKTRGT